MPMHDFQCPNGHEFERIVLKYDLDQTTECSECGEQAKIFIPMRKQSNVRLQINWMES
jgi:uncharacterized Zn finger protein